MGRDEHVAFALTISGAYSEEELEMLRQLTEELPPDSRIVEIGCMYGRSTSIYMQAMLKKPLRVTVIDNFCVNGNDARAAFTRLRAKFPPVELLEMTNLEAADLVLEWIDLLHVDGDHSPEGITADCALYLPKLKVGGVAAFHDYDTRDVDGERLIFPQIKQVVDAATAGWEDLGVVGRLAIRRKP